MIRTSAPLEGWSKRSNDKGSFRGYFKISLFTHASGSDGLECIESRCGGQPTKLPNSARGFDLAVGRRGRRTIGICTVIAVARRVARGQTATRGAWVAQEVVVGAS
eukprot:SAG31_NODE_829_length_11709_cov_5.435917_7_plen_106_part_00